MELYLYAPYLTSWSGQGKLCLSLSLKERTAVKFTDRKAVEKYSQQFSFFHAPVA
jgi:hypothetical protein